MRLALATLLVVVAVGFGVTFGVSAQAPPTVDFARDIQPLLRSHCYECHGPSLQNGNLRLDRRRDPMPNRVGANNARIVPGNSGASRLYLRVSGTQAGVQMPPTGALMSDEIALIKAWIDEGAEWPDSLAGETPAPPQDPAATALMDSLRRGDQATFVRLLRATPGAARKSGRGGTTSLMYAALYSNVTAARELLESGADPNARNEAGATALLWAVDDPALTRLLLERGADPNVRSADGRTPLFLAANRHGSVEIVRQLLAHDARVDGQPVLTRAAAAGDAQTMRLLIERGVEPDVRTIEQALESRCAECLELALGSATVPQLNRGLAWAASFGDSSHIRSLLDRGAVASGAALKSAAASEKIPVDGVTALLDRGARDEGALAQAIRHGNTGVVAALMRAGATAIAIPPDPELKRPSVPRTARAAVEKSLPLLQRVDERFLKTSGCVSCHNNSVFRMTVAAVRKNGFVVGDAAASTVSITGAYIEGFRERALQDIPIPGGVDTMSYILDGLAAAQYPPDPATDALARYLKRRQAADGRWAVTTQRPPIESSDAAITALTARALQAYAPAPQRTEYLEAVQRAAGWLQQAEARTMEDHAFRLLGLVWTHQSKTSIGRAVQTLKSLQRADGGWSQLPTLGSDSYATGQALVALHEAGVSVNDAGYRRGVQFLLATQLEDGSWYVRSRAIAVQPHFDSGFPHGADQFISAAATNWATMALAPAR